MVKKPRQALLLPDARLTRLMQKNPGKCASISEYAGATGLATHRISELLGTALDCGIVSLEPVGTEIFVRTAPSGRPIPEHLPEVQPNLWELLRYHGNKHYAYALWKLYRSLEFAGWKVEADQRLISVGLGRLQPPPQLAIYVDNTLTPLVLHPDLDDISNPAGPVGATAAAGARVVGIVTDEGSLDDTVTAARSLYHSTNLTIPLRILEAPSYHPVALTSKDAAITTTGTGTMHLDGLN